MILRIQREAEIKGRKVKNNRFFQDKENASTKNTSGLDLKGTYVGDCLYKSGTEKFIVELCECLLEKIS